MLEPLLKNYDINLIKEAKLYAEKYDVVYILDLIDKFMAEKEDITNKRALYEAISEVVEFIRSITSKQ